MTDRPALRAVTIALLLAVTTLLLGCGAKGDLYLPKDQTEQR